MNSPNILQQLYLKKALNEDTDGMFDHDSQLQEGGPTRKHFRQVADLIKANPAPAKRGELAKHHAEIFAKQNPRFDRKKFMKACDADETCGSPAGIKEGYHKKSLRLIRAGDWERAAEQGDRAEASALMRGGASKRTMKAHFNKQDYAAGTKAMNKFEKGASAKRKAAGITEGLLHKLDEGSRGTQRLKRIVKSVTKNYEQGKKIIGKQDRETAIAGLINPNNAAAKEQRERLSAGVRHMEKKQGLRRQINARTRAAAARERLRAGLNPNIPLSTSLSPSIVDGPLGKNINRTGGYEHQENPKRIPKAVQTYRKASAVKRNMYR